MGWEFIGDKMFMFSELRLGLARHGSGVSTINII